MEATRLRHLILSPPSLSSPPLLPAIPLILISSRTSSSDSICCSSRSDVRKPNWDASGTKRSKFYPYTELYGDDDDDDDDDGVGLFGFGESKKKQRSWWSDDDEYEDEGYDDEFWAFKILKVFGWMVPAILISILLGTGPNTLFMAVALPLAQTALSIAVDKVWGMAGQASKPTSRNRTRSKPFRSSNSARKRKRDADDFVEKRESKSTSSPSSYEPEKVNVASSSFGGWDELDRDVEARPNVEESEQKQQKKSSKIGKRVQTRGSSMLVKLLVAVFPILGSWARFL